MHEAVDAAGPCRNSSRRMDRWKLAPFGSVITANTGSGRLHRPSCRGRTERPDHARHSSRSGAAVHRCLLTGPLNGRKLADEAQRRRLDLRVVFTTGYTRNAIIHHGRLDEGVEFMTKPFSAQTLSAKIRAILDSSVPDHKP